LEYRRLAKQGINPRDNGRQEIPCFKEIARQVYIERLPTWKNPKHGQQRIKAVLDVAKSKGFREGENPVTTIRDARVLPQVKQKVQHHKAMRWKDVATFYADLATKDAMAAKALMFNRADSAGKIKRPKPSGMEENSDLSRQEEGPW